jgi:hypothetical protein
VKSATPLKLAVTAAIVAAFFLTLWVKSILESGAFE